MPKWARATRATNFGTACVQFATTCATTRANRDKAASIEEKPLLNLSAFLVHCHAPWLCVKPSVSAVEAESSAQQPSTTKKGGWGQSQGLKYAAHLRVNSRGCFLILATHLSKAKCEWRLAHQNVMPCMTEQLHHSTYTTIAVYSELSYHDAMPHHPFVRQYSIFCGLLSSPHRQLLAGIWGKDAPL